MAWLRVIYYLNIAIYLKKIASIVKKRRNNLELNREIYDEDS